MLDQTTIIRTYNPVLAVTPCVLENRFDLVPRQLELAVERASQAFAVWTSGTLPVTLEGLKQEVLDYLLLDANREATSSEPDFKGVMTSLTQIRAYVATVGLPLPAAELREIEQVVLVHETLHYIKSTEAYHEVRQTEAVRTTARHARYLAAGIVDEQTRSEFERRVESLSKT